MTTSRRLTTFARVLAVAALVGGCGARTSLPAPEPKDAGDPCDAIDCEPPPAPGCVSPTTLRTLSSPGICEAGGCHYAHVDTECPAGCKDGMCNPPTGRVVVSAGSFATCAVTPSGAARCWGSNADGRLGNASVIGSVGTPVSVDGLSFDVLTVSAGDRHACAVTAAGAVMCWGADDSNQLADANLGGGPTPVAIKGLAPGVQAISAGGSETCGITATGSVQCWGANPCGWGDPNFMWDGVVPVDIDGLSSGVVAVSLGRSHTCAVAPGGAVKCCGSNAFGELGTMSTNGSAVPHGVVGFSSGAIAAAAGFSASCAVTASGGVKCWGSNLHGQLGNASTADSLVPGDVEGLSSGAVSVTIGLNHACVLTTAGGVKCWGWNFYGQLGNGHTADSFAPVDVKSLTSGVVSVSAGATHTCAVTEKGGIKCWGSNLYGELGNDSFTSSDVPVDVVNL
jgi:alpha-tubulin suppressor-like RCC1 family protein